jgi:hypothetical protein
MSEDEAVKKLRDKGSVYMERGEVRAAASFAVGRGMRGFSALVQIFFHEPRKGIAIIGAMMRERSLADKIVLDEDLGISVDWSKWSNDDVEDLARLKPLTDAAEEEALRRFLLKDGRWGRLIDGVWQPEKEE